ncbi:Secreted effector protein SseJ [Botrimarina colliarenosi]|uniref:Secreted effector protein SseJ n=1 Tax=Botrimarina colliarenosi TaxID=2528001 RepID=A0A5C6AC74_9BACT|nr:SGNH/GDSL hydrolase family protein [Botrimarina colliarenosi]TWT97020.1 Secreted effector protein SseJ [Botrimarina colliarenosi]
MLSRVLAIVALSLATVTADAGPYTDLIVFGDSLSDVGNTAAATFGIQPGSNYYQGRFSNGPVYAEHLATGLGLGTLTRDALGGDDFAYGGAETNGPGGFEGLFLNSLVEQVDDYLDRLEGMTPDPQTLFVVFIGANDFIRGGQTNVTIPANVVQTQLGRLINAGASQFLGINLPLLGLTPQYNTDPAVSQTFSNRSRSYNAALEGVYEGVESGNPGVTIHRLDVASLFSGFLEDAASLGFVNTTQAGRDASGGSLDGAPGYVFWDGVHPTRELHALLGEAAIRAVLPAGDYDRDGVLAAVDYDAWNEAYGTAFNAFAGQTPSLAADGNGDGRVDAADYTLWRDLLATTLVAIPEPATMLFVYVAMIGLVQRPRG